ncbi:MAG: hypothetical protein NC123_12720 [Butyrivibrio sp.]|nr:hypothetical protein [Acetatifactor muris]MCM1560383.1 hypothetical protein [Butyrivibrio sp.]
MRYDRKIKYLDYCENGERVRGGGFLKLEVSGDSLRLELTVKGVRGVRELGGDVILCGNGKEEVLGKMQLTEGQGEFRHACQIDAETGIIEGTAGITCDELTGIRIPLGEGREIICMWGTAGPAAGNAGEQAAAGVAMEKPAVRRQEKADRNGTGKTSELRKMEGTRLEESVPQRAEAARDFRQEESRSEDTVPGQAEKTPESREAVRLLESKWLQLCAIYPHINPFRDQREYLSIGPEDFVLFSSESYKAASNSFMLHGYYNYRHLILTREERRGETVYYVGVPGNYYDREKQVAIMFGFESFECAQEPAQSSDFGYYMMKVQL